MHQETRPFLAKFHLPLLQALSKTAVKHLKNIHSIFFLPPLAEKLSWKLKLPASVNNLYNTIMRFISWAFSIGALLLIAGVGSGFWLLHQYSQNLPDFARLKDYQPPILSRVYAGDGRLLATFAAEQRIFVPVKDIPQRVKNAFLSAEDKGFYIHPGIDALGILRALLTNIQNIGQDRHPIGASTITQQVAKNMLLTNEVSISRKIREAILAFRIESVLSKDRILEIYLNQIYLGAHSYGVAAASLNYFNKPLDELSVAEAAFLAALPKAPSNYHPRRNHAAALARRNWVIGRMLQDGKVTAAEARAARAEKLEARGRPPEESVRADYFAEEVRRELVAAYGSSSLLKDGYTVRTSLDPRLQAIADTALRKALVDYDQKRTGWRGPLARLTHFDDWRKQLKKVPRPRGVAGWHVATVLEIGKKGAELGLDDGTHGILPFSGMKWARREKSFGKHGPYPKKPQDVLEKGDVVLVEKTGESANKTGGRREARAAYRLTQVPKVQGAFVAMDPHTGRVLALAGGFSERLSAFNRATQAMRQAGSAFKPFVYLAALDSGFTPSSLVNDAPVEFDQGPGLPLWRPMNFDGDFLGPTTLRRALEKSRNVVTVRLAQAIGMDKIAEYARKFGIARDMPRYLSFALGAKETTPLRLTAAYATLANGGKRIAPSFIDRIQDSRGQTIWKHDRRPCSKCRNVPFGDGVVPDVPDQREQINDPRTVYQIISLLRGVATRGTAAGLASLGLTLAGKTGTTNDSKDVWFVGFSPNLAAGVFIGYDDPKSLGRRETGGRLAMPVFKEFMKAALKDQPDEPFRVPRGVQLIRVNPHTGLPPTSPGERTILEAFLPGADPEYAQASILGGEMLMGDYYDGDGEEGAGGNYGQDPSYNYGAGYTRGPPPTVIYGAPRGNSYSAGKRPATRYPYPIPRPQPGTQPGHIYERPPAADMGTGGLY